MPWVWLGCALHLNTVKIHRSSSLFLKRDSNVLSMISSCNALYRERLWKDIEDDSTALYAETLCQWAVMTFRAGIFIVFIWQEFRCALWFNSQNDTLTRRRIWQAAKIMWTTIKYKGSRGETDLFLISCVYILNYEYKKLLCICLAAKRKTNFRFVTTKTFSFSKTLICKLYFWLLSPLHLHWR